MTSPTVPPQLPELPRASGTTMGPGGIVLPEFNRAAMRAYAATAVLNERERCASVCRSLNQATHGFERGPDCARAILGNVEEVAAAIRAEKQKTAPDPEGPRA